MLVKLAKIKDGTVKMFFLLRLIHSEMFEHKNLSRIVARPNFFFWGGGDLPSLSDASYGPGSVYCTEKKIFKINFGPGRI